MSRGAEQRIDPSLSEGERKLLSDLRKARSSPLVALAERAKTVLDRHTPVGRMCGDKLVIRTPEHAKSLVKVMTERHRQPYKFYLCPMCDCYHLASRGGGRRY